MTDYEKVERIIFLKHLEKAINSQICPQHYLEHSYFLLSAENEEEAIMYLRKLQIKENVYKNEIEKFKNLFPERKEEYLYLKDLYQKYKKYFNKKDPEEQDLSFYINIIEEIIKSDCSIEEYCSKFGKYKLCELRNIVSKSRIKMNNKELYEKLEALNNKNKDQFYAYIKAIVIDIKINDNFDILDYYYYTKLHPSDFLTIVKEIIPNINKDDFLKIKILMSKINTTLNMKINKEQELNGTTIVSNQEISREQKEKIFTFLEENEIPSIVYKTAIRRYANNDHKIIEYLGKEKIKK